MGREGKTISTAVVHKLIIKTAKRENIPLYKEQKKLISLILITLPKRPNPCYLARWCNHDVNGLIGLYPRLAADAAIIRKEVWKELLYLLNEKEFKRLAELLRHEKPENIRPQWVRDNSYALSLSIRRGFRDKEGGVDWPFIFGKLGVDNFLKKRLVSYHNDKKKIIARLEEILEAKNPKMFSPNWIYKNGEGLDHHIAKSFNGWSEMVSLMNEKWRARWISPDRKNIDYYEDRDEFNAVCSAYKDSLYLLYATESEKDMKRRNLILIDLVKIAQKGNSSAWDLLVDSIKLTVCADKKFEQWQNFGNSLTQRIRSAIVNFNLLKGDNFYAYLRKGLTNSFPSVANQEAFSLNEYREHDKGGKKTEIIDYFLNEEMKEDFAKIENF